MRQNKGPENADPLDRGGQQRGASGSRRRNRKRRKPGSRRRRAEEPASRSAARNEAADQSTTRQATPTRSKRRRTPKGPTTKGETATALREQPKETTPSSPSEKPVEPADRRAGGERTGVEGEPEVGGGHSLADRSATSQKDLVEERCEGEKAASEENAAAVVDMVMNADQVRASSRVTEESPVQVEESEQVASAEESPEGESDTLVRHRINLSGDDSVVVFRKKGPRTGSRYIMKEMFD